MSTTNKPCVEAQMLIRKPVANVFRAFIDTAITTNFWFTKSSGPLEVGRTVTWDWEMYGVSTTVVTKQIIPNPQNHHKKLGSFLVHSLRICSFRDNLLIL